MSTKLRSFSDGVNRKFESLGTWSTDHQLMLNNFIQERFVMANLVKTANEEIEKSKSLQLHNTELLRHHEADLESYKTSMAKLRTTLGNGLTPELSSMVQAIFTDLESSSSRRIETTTMAGDLQVADLRIQSLLREKDAELSRLRSELITVRQAQISHKPNETQTRTIQLLQDDNLKLKNEINELRVERGSTELIGSYKTQIKQLNDRILELEQEKSNLSAQLVNLRNQYSVSINVENFNNSILKSPEATRYDHTTGGSHTKSVRSPVEIVGSPKESDVNPRLVQSTYETEKPADNRRTTAEVSGSSYGVQQVSSTYQTPSSSVSSSSGVYNTSMTASGTGTKAAEGTSRGSEASSVSGPTYQQGTSSGVYQSGTYQAGSSSGVYQSGTLTGSGVYQSGGSGSGSGVYQSGAYQPGTYQAGSYQSGTYQSGTTYQPTSSTYKSTTPA